jgi:hypothetical protein
MTKDSRVYGIPLPKDATQKPSGLYVSNLDTVANFTAFYHDWMPKHGWTYEPKYSWTDPATGVTKGFGYTSSQVFCIIGKSPITTVIILVGSGDKQDHGLHAEISVADSPGESSCP